MTIETLWPFVFIAVAGWLATDIWRWLGVLLGNRIAEDSVVLIWVRAVATALVAAVVSRLILFPSGALAATPMGLRIAATLGFIAFLIFGQRIIVGVLVAEAALLVGLFAF